MMQEKWKYFKVHLEIYLAEIDGDESKGGIVVSLPDTCSRRAFTEYLQ